MVDMYGVAKNIKVTSGFVLQAMLVESLGISGSCKLQISCVT